MARKAFIIISDTAIRGKPISSGERIELDDEVSSDKETMGLLNHAGRIVEEDNPAYQKEKLRVKPSKGAAPALAVK